MSHLGSPLGFLSRLCEGQLDLASSCVQKTIIDAVNLLFLLMFYLLSVSTFVGQEYGRSNKRRDRFFVFVSLCCATISAAYLSTGTWDFIAKDGRPVTVGWVVHMVRGIIWITLALSSIVQTSRWVVFLSSLWWTSSFVLVSTLNVNMLLAKERIEILTVAQWPANFLLLICAFKSFGQFFCHWERKKSLLEPLLAEDQKEGRSGQGRGSFFRQLTFSWVSPLLRLGNSKLLVLEDIPSLFSEDEANVAHQKFSAAWEYFRSDKRTKRNSNVVIKALIKVYFREMMCIGIGAFVKTTCVVISPLLLYSFVRFADSQDQDLYRGLFLLGCMITVKVVEALSQRHWFFQARRTGMRMRSALMVAVYQKQLKLSGLGRKNHSTGEIVNYIAVDAYRMGEFPWWFHSGCTFTIQLFLAVGVLFGVVGIGALPGLIPLLVSGLLNVPYARLLQNCGSRFMKAQDERLRATSEILNNMKVIKLQSWEDKFKNLIEGYRDKEFAELTKSQHLRAVGTPIFWMCPTIISSVVFLGCTFFGSAPLNAATIFTVLATLRTMSEPVRMIPEALSSLIQAVVSFHRINTFLFDDELNINETGTSVMKNSENCIEIQEGNFSWEPESGVPTLRDVNLEVRKGQKIAVCGPVGAGKSSLLCAILKEIPKITGQVASIGSVAYVSQTSWIQSGTVRENILYGRPMEQDRYMSAIKASALDKDINSFQHGDLTEIGQRGINMSGGQKQRIQLARAVYNDADIYLLDDPFSAVDAHTAATLFHECVVTSLGNKTVILVTHQVEFLTTVNKILVMEDGRISQCGSYEELLMAGTTFEQLVNAHKDSVAVPDSPISEIKSESWTEEIGQNLQDNDSDCINGNNKGQIFMKESPLVQLTEEEEKEIGDVGWKPFFDYLSVSKGLSSLCLGTVAQIGFVICQAAATYWLAYATEIPSIKSTALIGVYAGISTLSTFFVYGRSFFAAHLGLKASKAFFSGLTNSIFKAPMLFFDSTPVGRIFTRVSSDLSILDNDISFAIGLVMAPAIELLAIIGVMASVTWQVLIVAIPAFGATKYIQGYYLASAREIVRMNGTTKAPVMNYAAETSLGVTTIRAFNMADRFLQEFLTIVDTDARLFFYTNASTEWLILRIEALQNLTLFSATLFFLLLLPKGFVASGLVGLSLSYALALTGTQVFMVRWYCNLTNYAISVERIKQFMHLAAEPPSVVVDNRPPSSWPANGRIELQDLQVKYRPNAPLVLKGITCSIEERSRVGVVGRTGSGKTTLISALFRLVEPESGRIVIDGLDITSIGLKDLRTKLSIIPQEPTLFRGSIRSNLDPLGLYSEYEIWEALEKCQLKETVSHLEEKLDSSVSDEGENWSTGQRQLFCLGRVLLKRNKILVLDEATASIDSATDVILQRIIRKEFADCTVITVAHRVPTVIDSDRVMVLSYGRLIEYDEPSKLLMQADATAFGKLVAEYWSSSRRNS